MNVEAASGPSRTKLTVVGLLVLWCRGHGLGIGLRERLAAHRQA